MATSGATSFTGPGAATTTTIRFDDVAINEPLPRGTFDLDLPGDVVELK